MEKRIYGLETEYALLFYAQGQGSPQPSQRHIFDVFTEVLQAEYPCAPAWYRKQGLFLANSLLLHYEARGDAFYQGLIEGCTPECLSPRELLIYQRTLDEILKGLIVKTQERLAEKGFVGRLVLGKNSGDAHGNTYGSHENYWVEDPVWAPLWIIYPLVVAMVGVIGVPILYLVGAVLALLLISLLVITAAVKLCLILEHVPLIGGLFSLLGKGIRFPITFVESVPDHEWLKILNSVMQYTFLPPVAILSFVLSRTTFRPIRKNLTSFLVTRTIFTGSGSLAFDEDAPGLHLSQRAGSIRSVMKIFWDDLNKPIYDIKNFIFEIGSPLRNQKRLHVLFSDSNMSEAAQYLKIGATGLVLKMIEAGHDFSSVELRKPVKALRKVSRIGHAALLDLKNGQQKSALQIQRRYLEEARQFIRMGFGVTDEDRVIFELWEETLQKLEDSPAALGTYVDWVIKKRLMDNFILERTNWVKFCQWGEIIEKLREWTEDKIDLGSLTFEALQNVIKPSQFTSLQKMARESGLDAEEFQFYVDLYYEVRKIDLRYHELSGEGGYYSWLESEGAVRRITREEELEYARYSPPRHTRAHIRGHYVSLCADRKYDMLVGWQKIRNRTLRRTIFLNDPFEHEIDQR